MCIRDSHWHECTAGDGAVSDKAAHTGGAATCERQAVCEVCGAPYGELADHTLNHVDRVEPTHFADGNIEYWECSVCHKLFSDCLLYTSRPIGADTKKLPERIIKMLNRPRLCRQHKKALGAGIFKF